MIKIGILKVKGIIVLCFVFLCCSLLGLFFLFVVWLCRFGYEMDEVMMY